MKNKILICLYLLLTAVLLVCAACTTSSSTTSTPTTTSTSPSAVITSTKATTTAPAATTSAPTTTAAESKWWDKFGEPKYGGTINYRVASLTPMWDVGDWRGNPTMLPYETLWRFDWTLDRSIWPFDFLFVPEEYHVGHLAESWEWVDPTTLKVNIRQGVKWQNKPPVNGRELTAQDIQFRYDRLLGTGSGFTQPEPMHIGRTGALDKATAIDKYTVEFKFKYPTALAIYTLLEESAQNFFVAPEVVPPQGEALTDWKLAIGTGPWMVNEVVEGSSISYVRNPDYWHYDPRHPQNRLPYADELKLLCIPDLATALSAIRTGKIDIITSVPWEQAANLKRSNPEILQAALPMGGVSLEMRVDTPPFTDIRVRKALQMAIDRKALAKGIYGGTASGIPCGYVAPFLKGYAYSYDEWPQELKDEYGYNPERSRALLSEAGYPKGFSTNVVTAASGTDLDVLQAIKAYFKDIGVDMEIKVMAAPAFMALAQSKKYDQIISGNRSHADAAPHMVAGMRYSKNAGNWNMNNDPAYDAIYEKIDKAKTVDELKSLIREADKYGIEQHWGISTFPVSIYTIYQPYLKGYSGEILGRNPGWIFSHLWIDKSTSK